MSYSTGALDNALFAIDEHGNLATAVVFDYENNASSFSPIKAEDPYISDEHFIALLDSDEFSPISIDADLMLWLDASDKSTLDKSNTWCGRTTEGWRFSQSDKSGYGHHAKQAKHLP